MFAVVNLARHLQVDSELALSSAVDKFVRRFRAVEAMGPMEGVDLSELDARWEQVKGRENQA